MDENQAWMTQQGWAFVCLAQLIGIVARLHEKKSEFTCSKSPAGFGASGQQFEGRLHEFVRQFTRSIQNNL